MVDMASSRGEGRLQKLEGEVNHERLWILKVLKELGVGGRGTRCWVFNISDRGVIFLF